LGWCLCRVLTFGSSTFQCSRGEWRA
jgi:hypothetical protein